MTENGTERLRSRVADDDLFSQGEKRLKYPSDRLTLGYIRNREPDSHTNRGGKIVDNGGPI
jgi:hypothetical protein